MSRIRLVYCGSLFKWAWWSLNDQPIRYPNQHGLGKTQIAFNPNDGCLLVEGIFLYDLNSPLPPASRASTPVNEYAGGPPECV